MGNKVGKLLQYVFWRNILRVICNMTFCEQVPLSNSCLGNITHTYLLICICPRKLLCNFLAHQVAFRSFQIKCTYQGGHAQGLWFVPGSKYLGAASD